MDDHLGDSRSDEPGSKRGRAYDNGLRGEDAAPTRAGGERNADEAAAVLRGDKQSRDNDEHDETWDCADEDAPSFVAVEDAATHPRSDVARAGDREGVAGESVQARR